MDESLKERVLDYIEGEKVDFSSEEISKLKSYYKKKLVQVFRGLYFESKEEFIQKYPDYNEENQTFTYWSKRAKSFSTNFDVAASFAQDLYSNYGIVVSLEIDEYLDLNEIINHMDFNHEMEFLVLDPIKVKVKILKEFHNAKSFVGLKD